MPTLITFLQILGGATGTGAVLGLWLWLTLKHVAALEADLKAANTALLDAYKTLPAIVVSNTAALEGNTDTIAALDREDVRPPTGAHRSRPR